MLTPCGHNRHNYNKHQGPGSRGQHGTQEPHHGCLKMENLVRELQSPDSAQIDGLLLGDRNRILKYHKDKKLPLGEKDPWDKDPDDLTRKIRDEINLKFSNALAELERTPAYYRPTPGQEGVARREKAILQVLNKHQVSTDEWR